MLRWCVFLLVCGASAAQRVAVAQLSSAQVSGAVVFTEVARGVRVAGSFTGALANGYYGLHVHEAGDVSSCAATGAHFDPHGVTHGGPDHAVRHVGDMGNVAFNAGVGVVDYVDAVLTLRGANSVLGRAVVFHEGEDDLGLRGDAGSLATGNAGGRLACGVVGLASPLEPWDSAAGAHAALGPLILLALAFAAFIR